MSARKLLRITGAVVLLAMIIAIATPNLMSTKVAMSVAPAAEYQLVDTDGIATTHGAVGGVPGRALPGRLRRR